MGKHFAYIAVATAVLALILSAICPPRSAPSTAGLRKHAQHGSCRSPSSPIRVKTDPCVKFISRSNGGTIFLTPNEAVFALSRMSFPVAKNPFQGGGAQRRLLLNGDGFVCFKHYERTL
jgi:hypothetical protein